MFIVSTLANIKYLKDVGTSYPHLNVFLRGPTEQFNDHKPSTIVCNSNDYEILTMFGRAEMKLFLWFWKKTAAEQKGQREILMRYQPPHRLRLFL